MSAVFIVEYDGAPVEFDFGIHLVSENLASKFTSEAEAWLTAYREALNADRVKVVNLYERYQQKTAQAKA